MMPVWQAGKRCCASNRYETPGRDLVVTRDERRKAHMRLLPNRESLPDKIVIAGYLTQADLSVMIRAGRADTAAISARGSLIT
jgi:hypothetical protein